MKYLSLLLLLVANSFVALAQKSTVAWSDEFKVKKGSEDFDMLLSDNSGIYLQESHSALKSYFVIGATMRESATLIKIDKNLSEAI